MAALGAGTARASRFGADGRDGRLCLAAAFGRAPAALFVRSATLPRLLKRRPFTESIAATPGLPWFTDAICLRSARAMFWCDVWAAVGWMCRSRMAAVSAVFGRALIPPGPLKLARLAAARLRMTLRST